MNRTALTVLSLLACTPTPEQAAPADLLAAPTTGGLPIDVPPLNIGETVTITVGNAYPGESVYLVTSTRGLGLGPCFDFLGGGCIGLRNPVALTGQTRADLDGIATFELAVPSTLAPGLILGAQAVVIHGLSGADTVFSDPTTGTTVEPDDDGDGVPNHVDPCPLDAADDSDGDGSCDSVDLCTGDDATGDSDADTVCDDLDPCPLDPADDSDGDGSCDSVDLCAGDDTAGDTDGDGACDDVDVCPDDAADDSDGDGSCDVDDPCPADPANACVGPAGKLVFVTSTRNPANFGGVAGADQICQQLAIAAGHTGSFKAWLSGSSVSSSPSVRFTRSTEPYVRADGVIVADNWADLTDGDIDNPINIDENGAPTTESSVYSFTRTDGTPGLFNSSTSSCYGDDCHCNNWTTNQGQGAPLPGSAVARTGFTNDEWTDYSFGNFCGPTGKAFYCFEQ